jgi:hypothetical protein
MTSFCGKLVYLHISETGCHHHQGEVTKQQPGTNFWTSWLNGHSHIHQDVSKPVDNNSIITQEFKKD